MLRLWMGHLLERYYASERDLADAMLADLDELERKRP